MHLDDLDTPAVIIDLDLMDRNIRDMAEVCRKLGVPLRVGKFRVFYDVRTGRG